jgi:diguanylate cyclase (GGDEF)-like protein
MRDEIALLHKLLSERTFRERLFNACRLVDPERGVVLAYDAEGRLRETGERCENHFPPRALKAEESFVKLEYAGSGVLLTLFAPITLEGRHLVAELTKIMAGGMPADPLAAYRQEEVVDIIQDLNRIASTDALTGLYNRRFIDTRLPEMIVHCLRYGPSLCVAMLDLDDFKRINDDPSLGHQAGDEVLIAVAKRISAFVKRGSDWVARYGGEEFLICLPGVTLARGVSMIERIRRAVAQLAVRTHDQTITITLSTGVCMLRPGEDMSSLIARCDKLLYQAKRNGKNRTEYEER